MKQDTTTPLKIFVYGTLKVGGRFAVRFNNLRLSVRPGKIKGTMFSIGDSYPGVILHGDNVINGEIHEYTDAAQVEQALDRIEGYFGEGDTTNLYHKRLVAVDTESGQEACIMYEFARDTSKYTQILEGEWQI